MRNDNLYNRAASLNNYDMEDSAFFAEMYANAYPMRKILSIVPYAIVVSTDTAVLLNSVYQVDTDAGCYTSLLGFFEVLGVNNGATFQTYFYNFNDILSAVAGVINSNQQHGSFFGMLEYVNVISPAQFSFVGFKITAAAETFFIPPTKIFVLDVVGMDNGLWNLPNFASSQGVIQDFCKVVSYGKTNFQITIPLPQLDATNASVWQFSVVTGDATIVATPVGVIGGLTNYQIDITVGVANGLKIRWDLPANYGYIGYEQAGQTAIRFTTPTNARSVLMTDGNHSGTAVTPVYKVCYTTDNGTTFLINTPFATVGNKTYLVKKITADLKILTINFVDTKNMVISNFNGVVNTGRIWQIQNNKFTKAECLNLLNTTPISGAATFNCATQVPATGILSTDSPISLRVAAGWTLTY